MTGRRMDMPDGPAIEDLADQPDDLPDEPGDLPDELDGRPAEPDGLAADVPPAESGAASRRRAAELIGDVLPDRTSDELDSGDWRDELGADRDDQLRADVPPHY